MLADPTANIEYKQLPNFDLSRINEKFVVAEFERNKSELHTRDIVSAIKAGVFFDAVLRVSRLDGGKFLVFDGRHRLNALSNLYNEGILKTCSIILCITPKQNARDAYRFINMGKRLTLKDHTKALDDGNRLFFKRLRYVCSHYKSTKKMTYASMLYAVKYAKSHVKAYVDPITLEIFIDSITEADLQRVIKVCSALLFFDPKLGKSPYTTAIILRPVMRAVMENDLDSQIIISIIGSMIQNKRIQNLLGAHLSEPAIEEAFQVIIKEIAPQLGLKLNLIEYSRHEAREQFNLPSNQQELIRKLRKSPI